MQARANAQAISPIDRDHAGHNRPQTAKPQFIKQRLQHRNRWAKLRPLPVLRWQMAVSGSALLLSLSLFAMDNYLLVEAAHECSEREAKGWANVIAAFAEICFPVFLTATAVAGTLRYAALLGDFSVVGFYQRALFDEYLHAHKACEITLHAVAGRKMAVAAKDAQSMQKLTMKPVADMETISAWESSFKLSTLNTSTVTSTQPGPLRDKRTLLSRLDKLLQRPEPVWARKRDPPSVRLLHFGLDGRGNWSYRAEIKPQDIVKGRDDKRIH